MGTNYYLNTDVCPHCERAKDHIHVGKSSMGWPFLFRGYREFPPDGVPHPITSAVEWRQFIQQAAAMGARLYDEYGQQVDIGEFFGMIEGMIELKRTETRGPNACANYRHGERSSEWYDSEGYRFCCNEFS